MMFKRTLLSSIIGTASGLLALSAVPTASAEELLLEEILVTARKIEESLQSVPVAVTAFSGALIQELNTRDVLDFEGMVPNLVADSVNGVAPGGGSFYIRGVGTQEVEKSFDPAVGVVIDGVYVSIVNGTLVNTFDFEKLEILRGPQGTLFGKNTTGGVISVSRSRPTGELGLKYEVTAGSEDRLDTKAVANFPIVKDVLAGKIGFASLQDGGWLENVTLNEDVADLDVVDMTGTLLWTPTEAFEALFTYQKYEDRGSMIILQNIASNGFHEGKLNPTNPPPGELVCFGFGQCGYQELDEITHDLGQDMEFDLDAVTLEMNWDLEFGVITSVTGYRETEDYILWDIDSTALPIFHAIRDQDSEQTSQEIRFASSFSEQWDFVAGFYYMEDEYTLRQDNDILRIAAGTPNHAVAASDADQERDSWSIFGEAHIKLTDALTLTLGGRYTEEEKKFLSNSYLGLSADGSPADWPIRPDQELLLSTGRGDETWEEFTPKIGLDWQYSDDILYYASYSEGFRSGGFNGRNTSNDLIGPYDPEFVNEYEIGMKSDLFNNRLRLNVAGFFTEYEDKQEEIIVPDPVLQSATVVRNASDAEMMGIEAEVTWLASANLTFQGNVGYLDAEYDSFVADINGDGNETDNSNLEMRRTPELTAGLMGRYQVNVGKGTLSAIANFRYTDEYQVEAANDVRGWLDDQSIVDLSLSYEMPWGDGRVVTITVFGRDVTDNQDAGSTVVIPGFSGFSSVTEGDRYGVSISGTF